MERRPSTCRTLVLRRLPGRAHREIGWVEELALRRGASGTVDGSLLEALEDYVKRQRKRLKVPKDEAAN